MSILFILEKKARTNFFLTGLFLFLLTGSFLIFFFSSCRLYRLEQELDPVNAEFLSKVRYIITGKERKIFLEIPDSEREKFKEEFWKRRDPDPDTEENEFKIEYFNRMERANELFLSEGKPGWMTDRGRIYILFGPPTDRITFPMGEDYYGRCREIWYYGRFPVVFLDSHCTGNYRLATYNLRYIHELSKAQAVSQKTIREEEMFFDFDWSVKKTTVEEDRIKGVIIIEIPYAGVWYKAEDDRLKTTLEIRLLLKDFENKIIWEYGDTFEIEMKEGELEEREGEKLRIDIPFSLEIDLDRLRKGKNILNAVLKNRIGDQEMRKVMKFSLDAQVP